MIPIDKFGNKIYPKIFNILKKCERILITNGYVESKSKANLFGKKVDGGKFYADMRGTEDVRIWEEPKPLFYWFFGKSTKPWLRRRMIKVELLNLFKAGCPCRLSFYFHESEEFENTSTETCDEDGVFEWSDGYCRFCKKDFEDEGDFCTPECEQKYNETYIWSKCAVCDLPKPSDQIVVHHTSYNPEKTIIVCRSCHLKIHRTNLFNHLKPFQ